MNSSFDKKLLKIIKEVYKKKNNFYHQKFRNQGLKLEDFDKKSGQSIIDLLPITKATEYSKSTFKEKCTDEKPGFHKLICSSGADEYYLLHRDITEIKNANLPVDGERPMVLMDDMYEAVETCLFFYCHKILPLIGEILNPAVVYATAKQYNVDSFYFDVLSMKNFKKDLVNLNLPIESITVIDSHYEKSISWPKIKINYIISLPEIGPIAHLCPENKNSSIFHPDENVFIEPGNFSVITSVRLLSCPMLRYKTNLSIKRVEGCSCGKDSIIFA